MIGQLRKTATHWTVALGILLAAFFSGCQTSKIPNLPPEVGTKFHIGDLVTVICITFSGDDKVVPTHSERIHEDGTITLSLIGSVTANGKTTGELQKEISDRYQKYLPNSTVTVLGDATHFYVDGEVQLRGQKDYPGEMTLVKAIAVGGGFTDFARKTKVRVTRGGHTQVFNVLKAIKDPQYDIPIYPGDKIYVPRRLL